MACYHPLKGWKIGVNPTGKPEYKITSYEVDHLVKRNDIWIPAFNNIISDIFETTINESIDIPCGHCIGCLLDRSRQWADRCMLEAQYHEKNCFITLTYDDDHIPSPGKAYDLDGVEFDSPFSSLRKKDFQLFMKRLRSRIEPVKIRFFACGEYGSNTYRPHYHAIIFGYDFSDDRILFKKNFRGENYYVSDLLSSCWNNGHSLVTDVSWDTCAYVARYCLKKRYNNMNSYYERFDLEPEFTLMSRKPGIARQYYDDNVSRIYSDERIILSDIKGSKIIRPPKYFDKLYDVDYPEDMERIKQKRKLFMQHNKELLLERTDLDYLDYLEDREYDKLNRTSILNERSVL